MRAKRIARQRIPKANGFSHQTGIQQMKTEQLALLEEMRMNREAIRREHGGDFEIVELLDRVRTGLG